MFFPSRLPFCLPHKPFPQIPSKLFSELHRPYAVLLICLLHQNFFTVNINLNTLRTEYPLEGGRKGWSAGQSLRLALRGQTPTVFLPLHLCAPRMHTWYNCPIFWSSPQSLVHFLFLNYTKNSFYSKETWCLFPLGNRFPLIDISLLLTTIL